MIYVSTYAGKRHNKSEDAVVVGTKVLRETSAAMPMPQNGFICVADGVGGNRGGAQASQFVLTALSNWQETQDKDLRTFLKKVNDRLIAFAAEQGDAPQMATTLTGLCLTQDGYKLVHIGNTRAYIRQGKYLKQITSDHTTYNWLMSSGQTEAAQSCNRSGITNCRRNNRRFYPNSISPIVAVFPCAHFRRHSRIFDQDALGNHAGEDTYADKCDAIIQRAREAGSEDDLSVVIVCPLEK
ncbi:MAG: PP2C family protein-serine/threonine phosphatase [Christensenellales bacterium]